MVVVVGFHQGLLGRVREELAYQCLWRGLYAIHRCRRTLYQDRIRWDFVDSESSPANE